MDPRPHERGFTPRTRGYKACEYTRDIIRIRFKADSALWPIELNFCAVANSAEPDSTPWPIAFLIKPVLRYGYSTMNLKVEYISEIEVMFETALGNESVDQMGSIHEKTRVKKSPETIPLTPNDFTKSFLKLRVKFSSSH